jgi:hypothetical protein
MKTITAALMFIMLAVGPTFAANPTAWQSQEGRASAFAPFSGAPAADTSREGLIHAN